MFGAAQEDVAAIAKGVHDSTSVLVVVALALWLVAMRRDNDELRRTGARKVLDDLSDLTCDWYWRTDADGRFTEFSSGIPAEWVMANLVLLVPLMLATPAATWGQRIGRLVVALVAALVLQVFDVVVGVKVFYATAFPERWGPFSREVYQFLDAFVQSWDTQLFPFVIWAGIHLRQLLPAGAVPEPAPAAATGTRAERRRVAAKHR